MQPNTIRAALDPKALDTITQLYAATASEILVELLQNARRAGATRIDITTECTSTPDEPTRYRITVTDDGPGIPDPAALLRYGASAWRDDAVDAESPAGMGLLSLSQHGAHIRYRCRTSAPDASGYRIDLEPEHFAGNRPAVVLPCTDVPLPHGTAVTFEIPVPYQVLQDALRHTTAHLPLTVTHNGSPLPYIPFLADAFHRENYRGIDIGIFTGTPSPLTHPQSMTHHGMPIQIDLPVVVALDQTRHYARACVRDAPELKLVLPSRREVVRSPFADALIEESRNVLYRALATLGKRQPALTYEDWVRARNAGIDLRRAPATLIPWNPLLPAKEVARSPHTPQRLPHYESDARPIPPDTILVNPRLTNTELATLARAAERNNLLARFHYPNAKLEGYPWYDDLPRLESLTCRLHLADNRIVEPAYPSREEFDQFTAHGPKRITLQLHYWPDLPGTDLPRHLSTDLALFKPHVAETPLNLLIATANCTLSPQDLAHYLRITTRFHNRTPQLEDSIQARARQTLLTTDQALSRIIEDLVERHVLHDLPDFDATLTLNSGRASVQRLTTFGATP